MRAVPPSLPLILSLFSGTLIAALAAVVFVAFMDLSPTWQILLFLMFVTATAMFWTRDAKNFLLFGFAVTAPIDVEKVFFHPDNPISPGLVIYAPDVFLFPLLMLWLWELKVIRRAPLQRPFGFKIATWSLAWAWVTGFLSPHLRDGILAALTMTKFYIIYVALGNLIDRAASFRIVLKCFGVGLTLNLAMVGVQAVTRQPLEIQGSKVASLGVNLVFADAGGLSAFRPSGFLNHPLALAKFLLFALPVLLGLVLLGTRPIGRWVWLVCAGLLVGGAGALVLTLSRGGWLSLGIALAFFLFVGCRRGLVPAHQIVLALVASVLGVIVLSIANPTIYLRLIEGDDRSTESRIEMVKQALAIYREHPLTGTGLGYYNEALQSMIRGSDREEDLELNSVIRKGVVHNQYLLVAAEQGTPGVILFMLLLGWFAGSFFQVRRWADPVYCALAMGLASGVVGQAVMYALEKSYMDATTSLCWTTFGLIAALIGINRDVLQRRDGRSPNSHPA